MYHRLVRNSPVNQRSPQAGTHACPGLRSGGPDSQGRPCPNTSVIPTPLPPSFPRTRESTPAPDSDPGARTPKADHAPTHPSSPRPPTVIPAKAGTHACPGLRSGGSDSQGRPCPNTSVIPAPTHRHSRAGGNPRLPRTPIRGPGPPDNSPPHPFHPRPRPTASVHDTRP